eukprot:TRINITY_DN15339_c0_g1_i1.p1 TRINITY_DN15339_c0_g1~~TRINITY_DN15339_c0_g1_i1.p1  ORF type:complete len:192 (-),score=43.26 TRINITY_DN15339_c0_g1_i1:329-904(-)
MEDIEVLLTLFPRSEWENVIQIITADFDVVEAIHDSKTKTFFTKRVCEPTIEVLLPDYRHRPELLAGVAAAREKFRQDALFHGTAHLRRQQALVRVWTVGKSEPGDLPPPEHTQLPDIYGRDTGSLSPVRKSATGRSWSPTQTGSGLRSSAQSARSMGHTYPTAQSRYDTDGFNKSPILSKVNDRMRTATR